MFANSGVAHSRLQRAILDAARAQIRGCNETLERTDDGAWRVYVDEEAMGVANALFSFCYDVMIGEDGSIGFVDSSGRRVETSTA